MLLLASALFIGVALGLRHNVFILIPASIVSGGALLAISIAGHDSFWAHVLVTTSIIVALQMGYFAGIMVLPLTGEHQDVVRAPDKPIENAYECTDVVYFHKYWLAKTQ